MTRSSKWDYLNSEQDIIRICVVETVGSAPRHKYSTMVLHAQNNVLTALTAQGSIGGGALEHLALQTAQQFLQNKPHETWARLHSRISLGTDLRQSCGGTVELLFEFLGKSEKLFYQKLLAKYNSGFIALPYESGAEIYHVNKIANELNVYCEPIIRHQDKLYLFGAGHVGRAVAYHAAHLDFSLHWIDFADERFPDNAIELCYEKHVLENPCDIVSSCEADSYFLVMSHSHKLDYEICLNILSKGDFRFLGLIGSRVKSERIETTPTYNVLQAYFSTSRYIREKSAW